MNKLEYNIKKETLLGYFLATLKPTGHNAQQIQQQWKQLLNTLNEDNIDEQLQRWELRAKITANRLSLGYGAPEIEKVTQRIFKEISSSNQPPPAENTIDGIDQEGAP